MKEPEVNRWQLLKDICIFQVKLALDAIRDLLLSPISVVSAVIDLLKGHNYSQSYFYRVMKLGRKTDHWLNLFGAGDDISQKQAVESEEKSAPEPREQSAEQGGNIDQLFEKVEALLKEQHDKGGLTASAKVSVDRYLDKIMSSQGQNPVQDADREK